MKHRRFISSTIAAIMIFGVVPTTQSYAMLESDVQVQEKTGQPFSSYWYPSELLQ